MPARLPALLALCLLAGGGRAAGGEPDFHLSIEGNAAARFQLSCSVEGAAPERVSLTARPPFRRAFAGRRLDCSIRQTAPGGRIEVETLSARGNRSRFSADGEGAHVRIAVE